MRVQRKVALPNKFKDGVLFQVDEISVHPIRVSKFPSEREEWKEWGGKRQTLLIEFLLPSHHTNYKMNKNIWCLIRERGNNFSGVQCRCFGKKVVIWSWTRNSLNWPMYLCNILMRCQCDEYDKVRKHDEARWNSTRDGQSENMQFYYFFVITQCNLSIHQSINIVVIVVATNPL